jgi:hypothetical protein
MSGFKEAISEAANGLAADIKIARAKPLSQVPKVPDQPWEGERRQFPVGSSE